MSNNNTTKGMRAWSVTPSERAWAISVAGLCLTLLLWVLFFPSEQQAGDTPQQEATSRTTSDEQVAVPVRPAQAVHPKQKVSPPAVVHKAKAPANHTPAPQTLPAATSAFFIQVGAFKDKKHAYRLQRKLQDKHWPAIIYPKKNLYAVQLGPYNKASALSEKNKLLQQEKINGFIVSHVYP